MEPHDTLSPAQVDEYRKNGFLVQEHVFDEEEIELLRAEAAQEFASGGERVTVEQNTGIVRGVHGCHLYSEVFGRLVRSPRLLPIARQLLRDDVYVHQFKIIAKRAFKGEVWEWHQDYTFWHHEDGMPAPRALSAAIFLDEVTEFNGPLTFVPGGHGSGMIDADVKGEGWANTLTASLKYSLDVETMRGLIERNGMVAPKGPRGSVLWFDANIPHSSVPNISPFDRGLVLITYNSVENKTDVTRGTRPEWLAARDFTPLTALQATSF
uniref:Phytanoyl-CoA dioxygenase n=1 Tax=uncultured bacterium esnapd13 TaxID=1366593 RepID=UPI001E67DFBD|nr:Chain A, Phytanoyl-CoA dioxygenase [uncultured bacterium esnapd13]7DT0_B Chain B, Phytanoyl-CoA dioxygenase [uncultured bacterium esnapd13]7DT0_C Chain C, Phytanoyl-CoA dioxygenase [uncultured bacterium esnapd13]7DT0_D Chain D, Phytanoyl-CoA dioxygenase [uncultured bacterium esnapd13]7DT0_E Chain E, Phytanoyl-CoA dioxygenase [uncultured bacterium esnapd13]7DT0_F Chain F, Phytanoyl-CoA dioxygenase [uncultured bacterium esnapd13]7DT0_G Chain G, Phytanoyl-CoA dioxygenase [uncultured bacterium